MKDLKVTLKNEIVSYVLLSFYVLFGYSSAFAGCCKKWPSLTLVMNHAPRRQSGVWKTDGGARSPTARVWQSHLSWPSRTSAGAFSDVSSWEVLAKYPCQTYFSYLRRVYYPHFETSTWKRLIDSNITAHHFPSKTAVVRTSFAVEPWVFWFGVLSLQVYWSLTAPLVLL